MSRVLKFNIKFSKEKIQYKQKEIKYIGHIFNKESMKPDPSRLDAIMKLKNPTKTELQCLLGMINYLRDFIPMSSLTQPLRQLLKKNI